MIRCLGARAQLCTNISITSPVVMGVKWGGGGLLQICLQFFSSVLETILELHTPVNSAEHPDEFSC